MTRPRIDASVSTPMPPMFTPMNTSALPNGDQCVAMSTVARPVTQITETAVKSASYSGAPEPAPARAIGSEKSRVKSRISPAKMRIAKRDGDLRTKRVHGVAHPAEPRTRV